MVSSGLLRRVARVSTVVSEEPGAAVIRVTKIGELGTTQQEPHGVTTQKTPFFIVTAVKTSNLTLKKLIRLGYLHLNLNSL
jgi:hypothetical protein